MTWHRLHRVEWTTHLRNLVTSEVSRAVNNGTPAHEAAAEIERVVVMHEDCRHCNEDGAA